MLITPESSGTLPEKEAKALENVRTEILIGEQKVKQLQVAERQLKGQIQTDLQDKARVISAIETLTSDKEKLESEVTKSQKELDSLNTDITQARKIFVEVSKATDEKEHFLDGRVQELTIREKTLRQNEQSHEENTAQLASEKEKHEERVTKLLNALK